MRAAVDPHGEDTLRLTADDEAASTGPVSPALDFRRGAVASYSMGRLTPRTGRPFR